MKGLRSVALVLGLAAALAAPALSGQRGGGGRRGGGGGQADSMKALLDRLGFTEQELAAVQKSMEAKSKARQTLEDELGKLREVAGNDKSTDQQLRGAIDSYTEALARYRETVRTEDRSLSGRLSVRSRARCLAAGALDNGLGMGGGGRGGGGGRRGGGGGRRP